jgi:hypothetical protein
MKDAIEANDAHRRNRENEGDRATLPATAPAGTGGGDVTESEPPVVRRRMHHPAPDFPVWVREFLEDKGVEVVMVVRDRHGHVWLHRKGHWRLPTGNLRPGEDPTSAERLDAALLGCLPRHGARGSLPFLDRVPRTRKLGPPGACPWHR